MQSSDPVLDEPAVDVTLKPLNIQNNSSGGLSSEDKENTEAISSRIKKSAVNDFEDDDLIGFKLPEVDWESLEAKLKQAQEEITIQVWFNF
jgi:hypothetical protein